MRVRKLIATATVASLGLAGAACSDDTREELGDLGDAVEQDVEEGVDEVGDEVGVEGDAKAEVEGDAEIEGGTDG